MRRAPVRSISAEAVRLSAGATSSATSVGVLFIDLRDHYGITQVVADATSPAYRDAEKLRSEWVVRIDGKIRRRPKAPQIRNW